MQIKYNRIVLSILIAACVIPAFAAASTRLPARIAGTMAVPAAGDQTPGPLVTAENVHIVLDHAPVAVSWALPANKTLAVAPQPYRSASREFLIDASGAELRRGIDVPITAKGDIVRISPKGAASAVVNAAQMQLTPAGGQPMGAGTFSTLVASGQQMRQAGMPIQRGSTVLKLNAHVPPGTARIVAQGARGRYLVQVYEPQSPFVLDLAANHGTRIAGGSVQLRVAFARPKAKTAVTSAAPRASLDRVTGVLVAPDGWSKKVNFTRNPKGGFVATAALPSSHAGERGLWEIHAFARGHAGSQLVLREATNAFAVVLPTAKFSGSLNQLRSHAGQNLDMDVGVDVAAPSRYAVSAVLYGHAANGRLAPAVYAQSADWLQPGRNVPIRLRFSATALARSGLKPPYQLRNLRLVDQMQLGLLERRAFAARGLGLGH